MHNDLKDRTKKFALDVLVFCSRLPEKPEFRTVKGQLMRCGTSVGSNYRATCRSKSKPDFINKLSIVEEEADESEFWFELLEGLGMGGNAELVRLKREAGELVAIMVQSKKTARACEETRPANSAFAIRNSQFR
jgi:four helix bundle protein